MSRTTIGTVVERIRRQLSSLLRYETNVLAANLNTTATVVTFQYDLPPSIRSGATISIGTETMRVVAYSTASKEVTVIRDWFDSEAATHTAGDEIWINPRFSGLDIFEAMHDEIASWPAALFRTDVRQLAVTSTSQTVELPAEWADMYGLVDVRRNWTSSVLLYTPDTTETTWPRANGVVQRAAATGWTDGPSTGVQFRLHDTHGDGNMLFVAARPFDMTQFDIANDLVDDVGISLSMLDMLTMGVKMRMLPDIEIARTERRGQDDSRRAEEVPPDAASATLRSMFPIYQRRRSEEITRLNALHPIRWK